MKEKPIDPAYLPMVMGARAARLKLLEELAVASHDKAKLLGGLAETEAILLRFDPNFLPAPRRLSHLQPVDAAIVLILESARDYMPQSELITQLLAEGVCLGNQQPARDIKRSLVLQTLLRIDQGRVSLAPKFYDMQEHDAKRAKKWVVQKDEG